MLERNPWKGVSPAFLATIPREKATAKYPAAMGMPSRRPSAKAVLLLDISAVLSVAFLCGHCLVAINDILYDFINFFKANYCRIKPWQRDEPHKVLWAADFWFLCGFHGNAVINPLPCIFLFEWRQCLWPALSFAPDRSAFQSRFAVPEDFQRRAEIPSDSRRRRFLG